jgi:hypothetical protein
VQIAPAQISAALRGLPVTGWQLAIEGDAWRIGCVVSTAALPAAEIKDRLLGLLERDRVPPPRLEVKRLTQLDRGPSGKSTAVTMIAR